jgi:short-subunit dehydrogenase
MKKTFYTLITGASEGFGKSLALECAARNMNLALVALPGMELFHLARFIKLNYGVKVECFEKDLSQELSLLELQHEIRRKNLDINMLINNAGLGGTNLFEERDAEFYNKQIKLNVLTPTLLTRLFLDELKRNAPSHILNVSSLAGYFSLPRKQVYGGTKSYLLSFSKSLRRELKKDNIRVSVLCPGGMNTSLPLTLLNKTGPWLSRKSIMDPDEVAPIAIQGMLDNKEVIIPGYLNQCFLFWNSLLPKIVRDFLTSYQMNKYGTKPAAAVITMPSQQKKIS